MCSTHLWMHSATAGAWMLIGASVVGCDSSKQAELNMEAFLAVERNDLAALKTALSKGASANSYTWDRSFILSNAVLHNRDVALVEALIEAGAKVDAVPSTSKESPASGATALVNAVLSRNCPAAELLLKNGADPDIPYTRAYIDAAGNLEGKTPRDLYKMNKGALNTRPCWETVGRSLVGDAQPTVQPDGPAFGGSAG